MHSLRLHEGRMSRKRSGKLRETNPPAPEVSRERLLCIAGIDPDGDPVDLILDIHRMAQEIRERRQRENEPPEGE